MALEIQLINQIEKHEFLYNYNLPEYNRKDLVEEAWANIATNTMMTVSDCKEKWRNIRSSFLRSMKPSGSKVKKPYYLTEYLKFILPFLKPINSGIDTDEHDSQPPTTNEGEIIVNFIKEEPCDNGEENGDNHADNGILNDLLTHKPHVTFRKRRRYLPARKPITTNSINDILASNSATKMFLLSLVPELETMTADQMRLFKIKVMLLIDELKVNHAEVRRNTVKNHERLQKRLINLLLRNLERTMK